MGSTSLIEFREWAVKLYDYAGFTDVEFNPHRSINCQARSAALFLSLMKRGELDDALKSPSDFVRVLTNSKYRPQLRSDDFAPDHLFADPTDALALADMRRSVSEWGCTFGMLSPSDRNIFRQVCSDLKCAGSG